MDEKFTGDRYRMKLAVQKYLRGEVSTWKAAEIAG